MTELREASRDLSEMIELHAALRNSKNDLIAELEDENVRLRWQVQKLGGEPEV